MSSWYVHVSCVDVTELQPLFILSIGILVQISITLFLRFREILISRKKVSKNLNNYLTPGETPSSPSDELNIYENSTDNIDYNLNASTLYTPDEQLIVNSTSNKLQSENKKWRYFRILLIIWQIISMIMIFILDIFKFIHFVYDHRLNFWDNFQCLYVILFTGSNGKTVLLNGIPAIFILIAKFKKKSDDKLLSTLNTLYQIISLFGVLIYIPGYFMYGYIGFIFGFFLFFDYGICCRYKYGCCKKSCKCCITCCNQKCCKFWNKYFTYVCSPWVYVFGSIIMGLCMVNVYSGQIFSTAISNVITERTWHNYWQYVKSDIESYFRFITLIL